MMCQVDPKVTGGDYTYILFGGVGKGNVGLIYSTNESIS